MITNWQIGDEIRDEEINSNLILVGIYEHQYECIAFNGSDFDTLFIPRGWELTGLKKTGRYFPQIQEMIKIMKE